MKLKCIKKQLVKNRGWKGWRTFIIAKIVTESDEINSFYFKPEDNEEIAYFYLGKYISASAFIPELGHKQPRQYSLFSYFNNEYYQIAVKKEIR